MPVLRKFSLSFLFTAALAACGGSGGGSSPGGDAIAADADKLNVVVLVIDSLMPEEIGTTTPNLLELRQNGTSFPESRAVFSAETLPNHVAMMTGVYGGRSGIPTNNFWDQAAAPDNPAAQDLDNPNELEAKTLFTLIDQQCRRGNNRANPDYRMGAVLSKTYLYEIFNGDAADPQANDAGIVNIAPDSHWDPRSSPAYIGGAEFTPDEATVQEVLARLPEVNFMFVSLGSVDRGAHASGPTLRAAAITEADRIVGDIMQSLVDAGRWDNTVFIVASDHGMDFGARGFVADNIAVQPMLDGFAQCGFEPMLAINNGGTDNLYVTNLAASAADRQNTIETVRNCLAEPQGAVCQAALISCGGMASLPQNVEQIAGAWYSQANADDPAGNLPGSIAASGHPNLGDIVAAAEAGYNFSEPDVSANPLPGNHGHPATFRNVMLIGGGVDFINRGNVVAPSVVNPDVYARLPEQSENVDIAPTVAWLLGLDVQPADLADGQEFDGRVLTEAFTQFNPGGNQVSPSSCGALITN